MEFISLSTPKLNNRGQIVTFFVVIAILFMAGIIFFFLNHLFDSIYTEFDDFFDESSSYNNSEAQQALQTAQAASNSAWDYAFLGIAIGYLILLILTSFSTRISPVFFWIFVLLSLFGIIIAVLLSNTWQDIVDDPEFATTITRFPITNALLGTLYPTFVLVMMCIFLGILFGKPSGGFGT